MDLCYVGSRISNNQLKDCFVLPMKIIFGLCNIPLSRSCVSQGKAQGYWKSALIDFSNAFAIVILIVFSQIFTLFAHTVRMFGSNLVCKMY